ncbi:hypothetical protein PR003_g24503 [Phytophthora rubi]|uniref:Uncharacterized protein n=1 Tax=Phytophthora rubi TaxID=129364 RepID=A0A6A4CN57_9STRA|nr:hypothetical protein PR003_g24503 [Phytophthora rubi]
MEKGRAQQKAIAEDASEGWHYEGEPHQEKYHHLVKSSESGLCAAKLDLAARPIHVLHTQVAVAHGGVQVFQVPHPEPGGARRQDVRAQRGPRAKTKDELMQRGAKTPDVKPHGIICCCGLLVARMLNHRQRRMYNDWVMLSWVM